MSSPGRLRIGALSKRVGVSPELLRAWESRYGLVDPERTPGGLRLYSGEDERRVRLMLRHLAAGLSAAEAARLVTLQGDSAADAGPGTFDSLRLDLERSFGALDDGAAQAALDALFRSVPLSVALSSVVLPFLNAVGGRWAAGEVSVAQEHFASNVIGGRLRARSRGWGQGAGPMAVLACPSGEQHDLGLLCFGLVLRERGWRITYLGSESPVTEVASVAEAVSPRLVVLAAVVPEPFLAAAEEVRALAARFRVAIGGAGATPAVARQLDAEPLGDDMVAAAMSVG